MRVGVIINPVAGRRSRQATQARVTLARTVLAEHGADGAIRITERQGHARELARELLDRGAGTVVAWGGDGTVNEVASQLAFSDVPLGIVPAGSGNGLARELGLARHPRAALVTALTGSHMRIDAGELGGRLLFNVGGVGFDAWLAERVNKSSRRGAFAYISAATRLVRYQPESYAVRTDWTTISQRALIVAVANTRQWGNQAIVAPRAQLDDGRLDIIVIPPFSLPASIWHSRRLFSGTLDRVPGVQMISATSVEIRATRPLTCHVDGEIVHGGAAVIARVHPKALTVRIADRSFWTTRGAG